MRKIEACLDVTEEKSDELYILFDPSHLNGHWTTLRSEVVRPFSHEANTMQLVNQHHTPEAI